MTALNGTEPKKRGRQKGSPKPPGSGRKRGTPNRTTAQNRERVAQEADPLGFWISVAMGRRQSAAPEAGATKRTWIMPTFEDQKEAMTILINKVMPALRSQELSGPDGQPITTVAVPRVDALTEVMRKLDGMSGRMSPKEAGDSDPKEVN